LGIQLDKWQIGPLRVLNLVTFSIVVYWLRRHLVKFIAVEPFLTLGKASLRVFYTHILFVFVGLALLVRDVGDDVGAPLEQLHGIVAILLVAVTFTVLIFVASDEVRKRRNLKSQGEGSVAASRISSDKLAQAASSFEPQTDLLGSSSEQSPGLAIPEPGFAADSGFAASSAVSLCVDGALAEPVPAGENSR
jgi:hypothetical protein